MQIEYLHKNNDDREWLVKNQVDIKVSWNVVTEFDKIESHILTKNYSLQKSCWTANGWAGE